MKAFILLTLTLIAVFSSYGLYRIFENENSKTILETMILVKQQSLQNQSEIAEHAYFLNSDEAICELRQQQRLLTYALNEGLLPQKQVIYDSILVHYRLAQVYSRYGIHEKSSNHMQMSRQFAEDFFIGETNWSKTFEVIEFSEKEKKAARVKHNN
jgi:hypothetical protein